MEKLKAKKEEDHLEDKYRNEINIKYETERNEECKIFGDTFVRNNKNNIELNINGKKSELKSTCFLEEGINNVKLIIKNKITNFKYMFCNCKNLIDISQLKYLDTKDCNSFSSMFYKCISLVDIKPLENWNVSNVKDFSEMFSECISLSDINSLKKWDVSNANTFYKMFHLFVFIKY